MNVGIPSLKIKKAAHWALKNEDWKTELPIGAANDRFAKKEFLIHLLAAAEYTNHLFLDYNELKTLIPYLKETK